MVKGYHESLSLSYGSWYPFDTQTCHMILQPDGNSGEFIQLVDDGLQYLGPRDLTQYFIRYMT